MNTTQLVNLLNGINNSGRKLARKHKPKRKSVKTVSHSSRKLNKLQGSKK